MIRRSLDSKSATSKRSSTVPMGFSIWPFATINWEVRCWTSVYDGDICQKIDFVQICI